MRRGGTALMLSSLVSASLLVGLGCGGGDGDGKAMGSEGGPCTAGGTCDQGLSCLSKLCVKNGGNTTTDGGQTPTSGGDPCVNAAGLCDRLNDCMPFGLQISYGDVKTCAERVKLACKDAANAPDSGLTLAAITACSQAIVAASCEDILYDTIPACNYTGGRTNGAACGTGEQCKSGYCSNADAQCGVCSDRVKAGATCVDDGDCQRGMECNDTNKCVLPSAGGTACSATQPCKWGYYCRAGSCAASISQAGGVCDDEDSCDIFQGLFCNTEVGRCQNIKMATAGSTCGVQVGEYVLCLAGKCEQSATGLTNLCSSLAKDGQACGVAAAGIDCMIPARCIGGRCKLPSSSACL